MKLLQRTEGNFVYTTLVEPVKMQGSKKVYGLQIVTRKTEPKSYGHLDYGIWHLGKKELFEKPMIEGSRKLEIAKQAFIQHLQ